MKQKKLLLILPFLLCACGGPTVSPSSNNYSTIISETSSVVTTESTSTVTSNEDSVTTSSDKVSSIVNSTVNTTTQTTVETVSYLITFKDEDGNVLESKYWNEGSTPYYQYEKSDTDEYIYEFLGWSLSLNGEIVSVPEANQNQTYYAVIEKTKKTYTLTFDSRGGSAISPIENYYGSIINQPSDPTKDKYNFVGWAYDLEGNQPVTWPIELKGNDTVYAIWNEKIDFKAYLSILVNTLSSSPYSYIPSTMLSTNKSIHVSDSETSYDFENSFVDVSSINYGGFGEQWRMVVDNLKQSQTFYNVLGVAETVINSSVVLFNNYFDNNTSNEATHTLNETEYTARVDYENNVFSYSLLYETAINIPLLGNICPQIDMSYDLYSKDKAVRVQLNENNVIKYVVNENSYKFAIEYGVDLVSRKAYFDVCRDSNGDVSGHIYEFINLNDSTDVAPACADFYITDVYTSVVGNKASGMTGFSGYINELYLTYQGKLLGYEVREEIEKWGFTKTYHTLWFNLNNITGINNVKAISNGKTTFGLGAENTYDVYVNNSSTIFEPTYNYFTYNYLIIKTSRKYDIEMRKQYFYNYNEENELVEYEIQLPMMFIQADHDNYTNYSDFPNDISEKNNIDASVNLSNIFINKIQSDYATLIDVFVENKSNQSSDSIVTFIGDAYSFN